MTEDELILTHIFKCSRSELYLQKPQLSKSQQEQFESYRSRRQKGEPLQYILGTANFMGLDLKVTPAVLIPRPETEILVDETIKRFKGTNILDIGTGSGNIAIALAKHLPQVKVTSIDISKEAQAIALDNARIHGVEKQIEFINTSVFQYTVDQKFDIVISNPPYISIEQMVQLPIDVKQEPRLALEAGADGLDFYRIITKLTPGLLRKDGWLMMEFGDGQELAVEELIVQEQVFCNIQILQDLAGRNRIISAQKI